MASAVERIEQKLERLPFSGCWVYMGALNQSGYGWVGVGSRAQGVDRAHRIMYRHYVGPIPGGKELDHVCRVRSCCNPAHLEAVTRAENCRRGEGGKATGARNKAKTHCPQGHEFTEANTYRYVVRGKYECRGCKICRSRKKELIHAAV